jgi:aspartate/tyrosine/aromatic aminotransferase
MTSFFHNIPFEPPNAILGVAKECADDQCKEKINLTVGAYRDEHGKPYVLPCVAQAKHVLNSINADHEYLVQDGYSKFVEVAQELMFGSVLPNAYTIQAVAGTGAVRLGADLLKKVLSNAVVGMPDTTWQNHPAIFEAISMPIVTYRYLAADRCNLAFEAMLEDIKNLPPRSILLLHCCAHNPSGCDPTEVQWQQILEVVKENNLLPYFDNAYQGFVSGDPDVDAYAVRLFAEAGCELLVASSFSKNFGLYGERIGALHVLCRNAEDRGRAAAVIRALARLLYSTCPSYGARIVAHILSDPERKQQWKHDCSGMAHRLLSVRQNLLDLMVAKNVKGSWEHIVKQRGMFSYTGIPAWAVQRLKSEYHIYMLNDGRISLAGLNSSNIVQFVDALVDILGSN